jgi:hypothetical protein
VDIIDKLLVASTHTSGTESEQQGQPASRDEREGERERELH